MKWSKCTKFKLFYKVLNAGTHGHFDICYVFPPGLPELTKMVSGKLPWGGHQRQKKRTENKLLRCQEWKLLTWVLVKKISPDSSSTYTNFRVRTLSVKHASSRSRFCWVKGFTNTMVEVGGPLGAPSSVMSSIISLTSWSRGHGIA